MVVLTVIFLCYYGQAFSKFAYLFTALPFAVFFFGESCFFTTSFSQEHCMTPAMLQKVPVRILACCPSHCCALDKTTQCWWNWRLVRPTTTTLSPMTTWWTTTFKRSALFNTLKTGVMINFVWQWKDNGCFSPTMKWRFKINTATMGPGGINHWQRWFFIVLFSFEDQWFTMFTNWNSRQIPQK